MNTEHWKTQAMPELSGREHGIEILFQTTFK